MEVTFDDCCNDLLRLGATGARRALDNWRVDPRRVEVVPFVQEFSHEYLYQLGPNAVRETIGRSSHALGDIESIEQLPFFENFDAPFALQHLFHWYVEHNRSLPTWREFRNWMVVGLAAPFWYHIVRDRLGPPASEVERVAWSRAARWRLGKFYLSAMREIDLLVKLRNEGFLIKYHLLADVLFRADFWINNLIVCIYFPNSKYRDGEKSGRKPPAENFFRGASPPFTIVHFPVERQGFGKVWWAKTESIAELGRLIRPYL